MPVESNSLDGRGFSNLPGSSLDHDWLEVSILGRTRPSDELSEIPCSTFAGGNVRLHEARRQLLICHSSFLMARFELHLCNTILAILTLSKSGDNEGMKPSALQTQRQAQNAD